MLRNWWCLTILLLFLPPSMPFPPNSDHLKTMAPLEFPNFDENYHFLDNSSIRENLASHSIGGNDSEVEDLLEKEGDDSTTITPIFQSTNANLQQIVTDTEWIENGENTEDQKFHNKIEKEIKQMSSFFHEQLAVILITIFLTITIIAYLVFFTWRRFLELKYGSREMLINEDEFMDPDDLKHFSI